MRFYDLTISDSTSGKVKHEWSSYPGGTYDPGALNVIFDLVVYPQSTPMGASTITLEGVQASILTDAQNWGLQQNAPGVLVTLKGGMAAGLPLANPKQQGILAQGQAYQVFGTWIGTQISLSIVLIPSPYTQDNPGPLTLNWIAGTPLATALKNALQIAYPKASVTMNISNIVLAHDEIHAAKTLTNLATYIDEVTSTNVQIVANGNTILVFDNSYKPAPKRLAFTDFVGQPMWIEPNTMQARLVLRGDIQVGDYLQMPKGYSNLPGFVQQTPAAMPSQVNYKAAMQGKFVVQSVRHLGNLRQPSGTSWCTMVNAVALSGSPS